MRNDAILTQRAVYRTSRACRRSFMLIQPTIHLCPDKSIMMLWRMARGAMPRGPGLGGPSSDIYMCSIAQQKISRLEKTKRENKQDGQAQLSWQMPSEAK